MSDIDLVAERQFRYGRMSLADLVLECERLREALQIFVSAMEPTPTEYDNLLQGAYQVARRALEGK